MARNADISSNKKNDNFSSFVQKMLKSDADESIILDMIRTTFSIGIFTTSQSVEFMLFNAAKYPNVQEKIYLELKDIFNDSDDIKLEMSLLQHAHYLRAFIEESWRLKASLPFARELQKDYKVEFVNEYGKNDYYILPKGCLVKANQSFITRSIKNGWKNPSQFDINNYLDDNNKFVRQSKMTIFSYGKRKCIGASLARKQIVLTLALLFYKYKFSGDNGMTGADINMPKGLMHQNGKSKIVPLKVTERA
eukprot:544990_1